MPDPGPSGPPPTGQQSESGNQGVPRRPSRGLVALSRRIIRSDNILVTVIAVAMTLSALSVYQATEASDQSDQALDQARVVHAGAARDAAYLQTFIDHDAEVLRPYCRATLQRDIGRVSYLDGEPDVSSLVASSLMLEALEPLKLGDRLADCADDAGGEPAYDTSRAVERLQHAQGGRTLAHADAAVFEDRAAELNVREGYLMSAALLFAIVVAAFFLIDQLGTRRGRPARIRGRDARRTQFVCLAVGAVLCAAGLPLLVFNTVRLEWTVTVFVVIASFLTFQWFRLRSRRRGGAEAERRARAQWLAEVAGAFTVVFFATAAVGLSLASIHERDATARADAERSFAQDLQRTAQQQSLRDLSSLSVMADLTAQEATSRQRAARLAENGGDRDALAQADAQSTAAAAVRAELDLRLQRTEQTLRDQSWASLHHDADEACEVRPAEEAPLPGDLYATVGSDQAAVTWHVLRQQQSAHACDIVAAISREEALIWSSHGSALTVALVVLGLAGFLFALAASTDRSARSSRTLLGAGAIGTMIGVVLSLLPAPELLWGARTPDHAAAQEFGDDVSEASVQAPCPSHTLLSEAVETFDGYGPAFEAKGRAAACEAAVHSWPVLSSDVRGDALPDIIDDLSEAVKLSSTPLAVGDLGWFQLLDGIHRGDAGQLSRGLLNTQEALVQLVDSERRAEEDGAVEEEAVPVGPAVHYYRFNRALALAALGETDQALDHYRRAAACLGPVRCEGGEVLDPAIRDDIVLAALADLELLDVSADLTGYRSAILGMARAVDEPPQQLDVKLTLFPQEVQVEEASAAAPPRAAVVWYYRADDTADWAVLHEPSRRTLHEGDHLDRPTPVLAVLPTGFYRADVYVDGIRLELTAEKDGGGSVVRHASQRLGVSVAVPDNWLHWPDDGVQWHVGPTESSGVTIRRVEGIVPDDLLGPFLERKLSEWPVSAGGDEDIRDPSGWFLGLQDPVINWGSASVEMAALAPYASHWGCGGALFLARVGGEIDLEQAEAVFDSIRLDRGIEPLPPVSGPLQAGMLTLDVPASWDAAIRPDGGTGDLIRAKDCGGAANVLVAEVAYAGGIRQYADEQIEHFLNSPEEYPDFDIEDNPSIDVPGADEAQVLRYTWTPEGQEPVRQWQIYAKRGGMVAYGTVTTLLSWSEEYQDEVELILGSLRLGGPAS